MDKLPRNAWNLIAILFATGITVYALSYIVTDPWHMLPGVGGDGAKNNFTYLYHSLYGHGYWFDGMNYPYGEHIVYTDGMPLLSVLFTLFKNVTTAEALTTLWWLTGLSYVLAIVFVYKILIRFKVPPSLSIVFATCIVLCSPQILCLTGHYALGFVCIIPMLFYWTIRYHEQARWRYCNYIFFTGIVMAFIHPYYMAMIMVFLMSYSLGYFIFIKQDLAGKIKHVLPLLGSAVCVFLFVAVVLHITDPIKDRPETPFFDTGMYTQLSKILSSYYSPIWQAAIKAKLVPKASKDGEGFTYIGMVAALTVLVSLLLFVINRFKKEQKGFGEQNIFSPVWLFIAVVALLFSMGIPFIWKMEWLMDYFTVFRQFRALGRFSWIFYYVITIYSAVIIYSGYAHFLKNKKPVLGYLLLGLSLCIWSLEASGYTKFVRHLAVEGRHNYDAMSPKGEQNWAAFLEAKHLDKSNFQAILLLPFFHIGTEKIWVGDPGWLITPGTYAALQLHLPIVDVMMSRSSWSVAQKQVKITGGPFAYKSIFRDIKSDKPFLVFTVNRDPLAFDENYLLGACDYIGDFSGGQVYVLYPERLAANDKRYADSVAHILQYIRSADTFITDKTVYINHFDGITTGQHLFGSGAVAYTKQDSNIVATIPINEMKDSIPYEFSCWFLLRKEDYKSPVILLECYNNAGKLLRSILVSTTESVDSRDMWFRASKYFNMPVGCKYIRCKLCDVRGQSYMAMDEMLLRPAGALVISKSKDSIMVNNHLFK